MHAGEYIHLPSGFATCDADPWNIGAGIDPRLDIHATSHELPDTTEAMTRRKETWLQRAGWSLQWGVILAAPLLLLWWALGILDLALLLGSILVPIVLLNIKWAAEAR